MIKEFGLDEEAKRNLQNYLHIEYMKQIDKKLFDSKDQIAVLLLKV